MEAENTNILPYEFSEIIGNDQVTLCWENVAKTYYLMSDHGINRYLKTQPIGLVESLEIQSKKLIWLENRLPVPKVIDYGILGEFEYLLTIEVLGIAASDKLFGTDTEDMIKLLADGLRSIHGVPIIDCPYNNSINNLLKTIRSNYNVGKLNISDLYSEFGESSVEKLVHQVEEYAKELEEDLVFTHGDYSLPNIIINNGCISGFIDLGNCGIADRYYDLAVVEKSIIRNFGKEYVSLFYEQYGLSNVDHNKLRFYQIVESLVWA